MGSSEAEDDACQVQDRATLTWIENDGGKPKDTTSFFIHHYSGPCMNVSFSPRHIRRVYIIFSAAFDNLLFFAACFFCLFPSTPPEFLYYFI